MLLKFFFNNNQIVIIREQIVNKHPNIPFYFTFIFSLFLFSWFVFIIYVGLSTCTHRIVNTLIAVSVTSHNNSPMVLYTF